MPSQTLNMPQRENKRKSDQMASDDAHNAFPVLSSEAHHQSDMSSPAKKRKVGITLAQKQALIDNLQLEVTERARKLRANYNLHAQSLRTRIEIRVNRIPTSLRRMKMGDLLAKCSEDQQKKATRTVANRGPPVPEKDVLPARAPISRPATAPTSTRYANQTSDELSGVDKENEIEHIDHAKKKGRGAAATDASRNPGQILSPTSSNSRNMPRDRPWSPTKSMIARPVSPVKGNSATNILSSMVEKARATRVGATQRKATNASTASSTNGNTASTATRGKRGPVAASTARQTASRATRRASGNSESSDGSTGTVVRKKTGPTAKAATVPAKKTGMMNSIKKGVANATSKRTAAAKAAPPTTGRVLRKRG